MTVTDELRRGTAVMDFFFKCLFKINIMSEAMAVSFSFTCFFHVVARFVACSRIRIVTNVVELSL